MMIFELILAFIAGVLVKIVDWLDDEKKSKHWIKYVIAILYGLFIGYIIGATSFSVIFIAAILAQVFARKVDTPAHEVGFVTSVIAALFFNVPVIDPLVLIYFMVFAILDEFQFVGKWRKINEYRPFLKIAAFAMLLTGRFDYFLGIIAFDIGYEGFKFCAVPIINQKCDSVRNKQKKNVLKHRESHYNGSMI